jgi:hypothetical protein
MKWKINPYVPKEGDTRTIRKFAWLPTDCGEYRVWLESYESVQKYKKMAQLGEGHGFWALEWVEIERNYLVLYP